MRFIRQPKTRRCKAVSDDLKEQTIDAVHRAFAAKDAALTSFGSPDDEIMISMALLGRRVDLLVLYEKLQGIYPRRLHLPFLARLRASVVRIKASALARETNAPVDAVKRVLFGLLKAEGYDLKADALE